MSVERERTNLDVIFRECGGDLSVYFTRRHGAAADDLVQESFLQLARRLSSGETPRSPRAYLFGIARHVSMAFFRKQRAVREEELGKETEPAQIEETDGRLSAAREVIAGLPALQREILDLRFVHGLSYADIAIALGVPGGTVRSRLHNAIGLLRKRIESEEE